LQKLIGVVGAELLRPEGIRSDAFFAREGFARFSHGSRHPLADRPRNTPKNRICRFSGRVALDGDLPNKSNIVSHFGEVR
jgi:hypothetical protein